MKPTLTVTTEFGIFKRQTSRKYTHFVITTGESVDKVTSSHMKQFEGAKRHAAEAQLVVDAMIAANAKFAARIDGHSYNEMQMIRSGQVKRGQIVFADNYNEIGYWPLDVWQGYAKQPDVAEYAARIARDIERSGTYRDIQWSSRLNLAMKYADKLRGRGYENVKIIEIATGKAVL